jgi:uncharacterized protein (DUF1501 family)|tara:strand:- start:6899 stop:8269 length:1371 start_codon:yes stop_codon:yes gene_type:complete
VSFAGSAGLLTALGNSKAYAADMSGYKALVCLFFFGGQDAHDTVLPFDQSSYDGYAALRSGLFSDYAAQAGGSSRERARLRELAPTNAAEFGGRQFALPEALDPLKALFDSGNAAIIGNVGPLIEPMVRSDFNQGIKTQPQRLFSHNDQQSTWMSSSPEGETLGWGGRLVDNIAGQTPIFSAISTFGNTVFLSGQTTTQFALSTSGPPEVSRLRNNNNGLLGPASGSDAAAQLLIDQYKDVRAIRSNLYEKDSAAVAERAFSSNEAYRGALDNAVALETAFPSSRLGAQLGAVAEAISIRGSLNMSRQVFFVGMGGFDTHDNQAEDLTLLHTDYAASIAAFYAATQELGIENDVTLFTGSDFGRSLVGNGNGTDHGWGAHHFVVGGAVNGNHIYGDIPPYATGHAHDAGNGRLIPNVSVEQYAATLGKWYGLTDTELTSVFPSLVNFAQKDLGFMV